VEGSFLAGHQTAEYGHVGHLTTVQLGDRGTLLKRVADADLEHDHRAAGFSARTLLVRRIHAVCMNTAYHGGVDTTVVQVRDVPVSVLTALKARAEARGISLSSFLRDLMASEAAMPPIDDVMRMIAGREPVSYASEDLRSFTEDGRR
jgi:hypothetical protein